MTTGDVMTDLPGEPIERDSAAAIPAETAALAPRPMQRARPSRRQAALAALLLGALAATGFAPLNLWPVTLVCLAGWLWLVHDAPTMRTALLRGWLLGASTRTTDGLPPGERS